MDETLSFTPVSFSNKKHSNINSPSPSASPKLIHFSPKQSVSQNPQTNSNKPVAIASYVDHEYLAYFLQFFSCIVWTSSYIYTNEHSFSTAQVILAKGFIGTPANYLILYLTKNSKRFPIPECNLLSPALFTPLLLINTCILLYFYALPLSQLYLPLPIVHTIGCSSIAIIYIIDYMINGVEINKNGIIGVVLALVGVIGIANNRLIIGIFGPGQGTQAQGGFLYKDSSVIVGIGVAFILLLARIGNCYGLVQFKKLPISIFHLNLHNNILSIISGSLLYMVTPPHLPLPIFAPSLFTIGVGQFICMTTFFYSLKLTKKTGNVMIINAANIVIAFMISYWRYDEKFNWVVILGAGLLAVSMGIVIYQGKNGKKENLTQKQIRDQEGEQQGQARQQIGAK